MKHAVGVAYHFFNDFDTRPEVERLVRKTYDGPLALAVDYMVFNVTKDDIKVRMAVINEDVWPLPSVTPKLPADPSQRIGSPSRRPPPVWARPCRPRFRSAYREAGTLKARLDSGLECLTVTPVRSLNSRRISS